MDRATARLTLDRIGSSPDVRPHLVLPSRDNAHETTREVLESESGIMLVTGDAAMGKTWLRNSIERELPLGYKSVTIDCGPGDRIDRLEAKLAHALGLEDRDRLACLDFLAERCRNDERWTLIVEEAHNLSLEMLEAVRVLFERSSFASWLLLGRTSLARRISTPSHSSIAARLSGFEHLGPIDADEAEVLLNHHFPSSEWSMESVERLHRDAAGIPGLLIRLASREVREVDPAGVLHEPEAVRRSTARGEVKVHRASEPQPHFVPPLLGVDRPPLRVEDGVIEVGWNSDNDLDESEEPVPGSVVSGGTPLRQPLDEPSRESRFEYPADRSGLASPTSRPRSMDE
ncbi:MAG: ATP-binding protein [Isosphaeraceae bacterium]|nr:ATP-binding protein [Isosphaeraceae bacterium]